MNESKPLPKKVAMNHLPRVLRLVAACLLIGLLVPQAVAQPMAGGRAPRDNPDNPRMSAEIGYGGAVWPSRWVPLTVTLTGGAKAFDGVLSVAYSQDQRSSAQILRSVAATPGKTTTFQTLVCVPPATTQVVLSLEGRSGRNVAKLTLTTVPDATRGEAPLPPVLGVSPTVLALGAASNPALSTVRSMLDQEEQRHAIGRAVPAIAFTPASQAPVSWAALDSVLLLVTTGETAQSCDPRSRTAVREWVSGGGRLVILAAEPGEAWRTWLAGSLDTPAPVSLGSPRSCDMPTELANALSIRPPQTPSGVGGAFAPAVIPPPGAPPSPAALATPATPPADAGASGPDLDERFAGADRLTCRPLSLAPHAAERGWSLRYPIADSPGEACVAEGPHGFGWVVVVGFDPQTVASPVSSNATRRVWHDLLGTALADFRDREVAPVNPNMSWMRDQFSNGGLVVSDAPAQAARNSMLNFLSNVPSIGHSVFPILAVGMFALAMLIGPVDALLLRSLKARHRSWLTAIGWISLASAAAYVVPDLIRSGNTLVNRVTVIDAMQTGPDPSTAAAPGWRIGITGVFAGSSIYRSFAGEMQGSWWKPTSSEWDQYWARSETGRPRRSFPTFQATPDLTTLAQTDDPWGGIGPGHNGAGGNIPGPSTFPLWTFRTFQDQARASTPIRARVERDDSSSPVSWRVELTGIPKGATLSQAALSTADGWRTLAPDGGDTLTTSEAPQPAPTGDWAVPDISNQNYYYGSPSARRFSYGQAFLLPGPDQRGLGIAQALERGDAVLYLSLSNVPPDITLAAPDAKAGAPADEVEYRCTQIIRLVVPVTIAAPPETSPAPTSEEPSK